MPVLVSSPDFCSAPSSLLVVVGYMCVLCWCLSCGWWCEFLVLSLLEGFRWGGGGEAGGGSLNLSPNLHIVTSRKI